MSTRTVPERDLGVPGDLLEEVPLVDALLLGLAHHLFAIVQSVNEGISQVLELCGSTERERTLKGGSHNGF